MQQHYLAGTLSVSGKENYKNKIVKEKKITFLCLFLFLRFYIVFLSALLSFTVVQFCSLPKVRALYS